jgi:hypothetical protein
MEANTEASKIRIHSLLNIMRLSAFDRVLTCGYRWSLGKGLYGRAFSPEQFLRILDFINCGFEEGDSQPQLPSIGDDIALGAKSF